MKDPVDALDGVYAHFGIDYPETPLEGPVLPATTSTTSLRATTGNTDTTSATRGSISTKNASPFSDYARYEVKNEGVMRTGATAHHPIRAPAATTRTPPTPRGER